jgi:hypothetical protein
MMKVVYDLYHKNKEDIVVPENWYNGFIFTYN